MALSLTPEQRTDITEAEPLLDEIDICPRKTRFSIYKKRNIIERFFVRLKLFRGIATRYDKLKSTFIAAVQLVYAVIGAN